MVHRFVDRVQCEPKSQQRRGQSPEPAFLCADFAFRVTNILTEPRMPAAKRTRGGRKSASSARKGRSTRGSTRTGSSARSKNSRSRSTGSRKRSAGSRKSASRSSVGRKSTSRKGSSSRRGSTRSSARKSTRRRTSAVARVKRVASGVVHQAAGLGERAVETVTEFVQDRF